MSEPREDEKQPNRDTEIERSGPDEESSGSEDGGDDRLPHFVTRLTSIEQQVGNHVTVALQHPDTVAVLSTVAVGKDGGQHIISIGLDVNVFEQIKQLLEAATEEHKRRVPCIGFHCRFQDRED